MCFLLRIFWNKEIYFAIAFQDGLKLNGTHQLLFYADDCNMFGGSVYTVKKNTEALVVDSKENGLEVNADKN